MSIANKRYAIALRLITRGKDKMRRGMVSVLFSIVGVVSLTPIWLAHAAGQQAGSQDHTAWVASVLERMQTIKPGMTPEDLLKVFTTEGGLSTPLHRRFVSRDCPYFKIDVDFDAVGRPNRDKDGRVTPDEDNRDIIVSVSRPYLQFSIMD